MQPSHHAALDFYDSLLIFDHICPFAIENLPAMSRRVFDVGLDMGRIRNGLKHNKENKRSKSYRSTPSAKDDTYIDNTPVPNGHNALVPTIKHKKSSPTISEQREFGNDLDPGTVVLPSTDPDETRSFPLPPSHRATPDDHLNAHEERTLYSSQLSQHNDSPTQAQAPDFTRRHSDAGNFDLKPPPPNTKVKNLDILSEQLFSGEHLRVILKEPSFFLRFTAFLNRYKPHSAPVLVRYLEAQKALKAVEYANALAETIKPGNGEHASPCPAASVDPRFEARLKRSFDSLVNEALPAYITNCLTRVVTESMVREITGTGMPVMRELVGGLAEVFCLADPGLKDCPIVYASEEFYRTTRYARDDVLGNNCRFLQGPKTNRTAIARISTAVKTGQEVCETVLNYRRDGSPFMNLLLTAPLYDNRGAVRYFIGAQIDVSGLIEDGRGLDSFERYLSENRPNRNRDSDLSEESFNQKHLRILNEFSQMLSMDESSLFTRHSRESSVADNASSVNFSARGTPARNEPSQRRPRRVLGNEDDSDERDKNTWVLSSIGPSGRLPGVYQNVRPLPPHHTPIIPHMHSPHSGFPHTPHPCLHTIAYYIDLSTTLPALLKPITNVYISVPPRPPPPLPTYHLRLPSSPHPRPPPIPLPLPHRRPTPRPHRPRRSFRARRRRHSKSNMVTAGQARPQQRRSC